MNHIDENDQDAASSGVDVPVAHTVEHGPLAATQSVLDTLRASAIRKRAHKKRDWPIADYDGLYVTFQLLEDYNTTRAQLLQTLKRRGVSAGSREISIALKMLIAASVDSYAIVNDQRYELGLPLGIDLYDQLWPAGRSVEGQPAGRPRNDEQAVIMLFGGNTVRITSLAAELDQWFKGVLDDTADELVGES